MEASSASLFPYPTYTIPSSRGSWRKLKRYTASTRLGRCASRVPSMISSISGGGLRGKMAPTTTTTTIITTSPVPCPSTLVDGVIMDTHTLHHLGFPPFFFLLFSYFFWAGFCLEFCEGRSFPISSCFY